MSSSFNMAYCRYIIQKTVGPTGDELVKRYNIKPIFIKPIFINPLKQRLMSLTDLQQANSLFASAGFLLKATCWGKGKNTLVIIKDNVVKGPNTASAVKLALKCVFFLQSLTLHADGCFIYIANAVKWMGRRNGWKASKCRHLFYAESKFVDFPSYVCVGMVQFNRGL